MYKLFLIDDEYLVRKGIAETIDWASYNIEIAGEAENGEEALRVLQECRPDIILTDIRMPKKSGLELISELRLECIVIILSGYEEFEYVRTALKNGAFAYLTKPVNNDELIKTVLDGIEQLEEIRNYSRIKQELSTVKRHFLIDLLHGEITDSAEINNKLDIYEIDLPAERFTLVYAKFNKNNHHHTLLPEGITVVYGKSELVSISNQGLPETEAHLRRTLREIESEAGCTVSISLSECVNLYDIAKAFAACRALMENSKSTSISWIHLPEGASEPQNHNKVDEVIRYIHEHFHEELTVEQTADKLYISASYLMHILKQATGKTFIEHLTEARISAAKELLCNSRYKIYEVCDKIGYRDVKYFSQIFKKQTGMTPREYAKSKSF